MELFGGQFLSVHAVLCVQAARVYVPPLFLVSRESMHNPPTIQSTTAFGLSSSLSLVPLSLSLFIPVPSARLFFVSKILSIRANKQHSLNSPLRSAVRKIKRFSRRLLEKEWTRK